uniref:Putative hyaluronan mediated motility receptor isoform X1 n=1 Tax=Davidia involucrata TaxID=16924 RepID=A0A5B6ZF81_DAVIN
MLYHVEAMLWLIYILLFLQYFHDSTCEMRRSIETRDRKLTLLYEKINAHLLLFDSIEKEAFSVKQVVDNVQHLVSEKEEIVAGLKSKMDKVSTFEKVFVEKISELENKLRNDENELRGKERNILELEAQLEAAKISNNYQVQIEEISIKALTKFCMFY